MDVQVTSRRIARITAARNDIPCADRLTRTHANRSVFQVSKNNVATRGFERHIVAGGIASIASSTLRLRISMPIFDVSYDAVAWRENLAIPTLLVLSHKIVCKILIAHHLMMIAARIGSSSEYDPCAAKRWLQGEGIRIASEPDIRCVSALVERPCRDQHCDRGKRQIADARNGAPKEAHRDSSYNEKIQGTTLHAVWRRNQQRKDGSHQVDAKCDRLRWH